MMDVLARIVSPCDVPGFAGKPTRFPLVNALASDDTILVPINPITRPGTPRSARDMLDRVEESSFNSVAPKALKMLALWSPSGARSRRSPR